MLGGGRPLLPEIFRPLLREIFDQANRVATLQQTCSTTQVLNRDTGG